MTDQPTRGPEGDDSEVLPEQTSVRSDLSEREPLGDFRDQLRSRRWNAAPLRNPEVQKTDPRIAVAFIVILCAITLVVLVIGYGSGFWSLPGDEGLSGAVAALELPA